MFCKAALLLAIPACLALDGCGQHQPRPVERLAILPLENLSSDVSLDWMSRLTAEIIAEELTGSPSIHPMGVEEQRDAAAFRATQVLRGYFTVTGDRIEVRAHLEDTGRRKIVKTLLAEGPAASSILPLADSLARQLSAQVRPFGSEDPEAIRAYASAFVTSAASDREAALERVLAADPGFGQAHVAWARFVLSRGDRDGARDAVENALDRAGRIDEINQARLNVILASLDDDLSSLAAALEKLARLTPADSDLAERTGRTIMSRHRYSEAATWLRKAAVNDPARPARWNTLAYAQAYARNLEGACESLRRYREAEPENPNALDSLGEVHFHLGRFAEAERFFLETHRMSPAFQGGVALVKAARARLMTGEIPGAEALFRQYAELRAPEPDPSLDYRTARWRYWTGRRRQAMADLDQLARREDLPPDVASSAYAQLSVWALGTGQAPLARQYAAEALSAADTLTARARAGLCQFMSKPPVSAAEWERRARRAFPDASQTGVRKQALAYALLFSKHFAEAGAILRELYEQAAPFTRGEIQVLLGWTLIESGQLEEARELLAVYPVLEPGGESLFYSLVFPRALYLRGVLAQASGDEQAAANYRLFLHCSGEAPATFGEEDKARRALASAGAP